jgi:hypothetical protein
VRWCAQSYSCTVLLLHSLTPAQSYSCTVLLLHSLTPAQSYSCTVLLLHSRRKKRCFTYFFPIRMGVRTVFSACGGDWELKSAFVATNCDGGNGYKQARCITIPLHRATPPSRSIVIINRCTPAHSPVSTHRTTSLTTLPLHCNVMTHRRIAPF